MGDTYLVVILALDSTVRLAVPLVFASLAGLFSERSGIIDIGLEGKMLAAAFAAGAVAAISGSAWTGLAAAVAVSVGLALLHGFACITHRGNQVVSGLAINILAAGLTVTLGHAWFRQGGQTPTLGADARFGAMLWPGAESIGQIPGLGPIYQELMSGHNALVYLAFALVPVAAWILTRTRFGLRLRAVGENPEAVDTAGISVTRVRYQAVMICGALCGLAGAYLSTAHGASFVRDMTAGKGYIALAAMIFGKWRPVPTMLACILFGLLDAMATRLQGVSLPLVGQAPVQLVQALPYLLTVILLAGFIGRAVAPRASGIPYAKNR